MSGPIARKPKRTPVGAPPRIRPVRVWVVSVVLALVGLFGTLVSWELLADAVDHGEGAAVVLFSGVGLVLALTQIRNGVVIFLGRRGGRGLAATICTVNLAAALFVLAAGAPQAWGGIVVNLAVILALMGEPMAKWCDET